MNNTPRNNTPRATVADWAKSNQSLRMLM